MVDIETVTRPLPVANARQRAIQTVAQPIERKEQDNQQ
jgi:hypothetical protein